MLQSKSKNCTVTAPLCVLDELFDPVSVSNAKFPLFLVRGVMKSWRGQFNGKLYPIVRKIVPLRFRELKRHVWIFSSFFSNFAWNLSDTHWLNFVKWMIILHRKYLAETIHLQCCLVRIKRIQVALFLATGDAPITNYQQWHSSMFTCKFRVAFIFTLLEHHLQKLFRNSRKVKKRSTRVHVCEDMAHIGFFNSLREFRNRIQS